MLCYCKHKLSYATAKVIVVLCCCKLCAVLLQTCDHDGLLQIQCFAVALQTYGNLTTEAGLSELAGYASGMGPDKQAYILNISSSEILPWHTLSTSFVLCHHCDKRTDAVLGTKSSMDIRCSQDWLK